MNKIVHPELLFRQQIGQDTWKTYDSLLHRLRCREEDDFESIWGKQAAEDQMEETPILSFKFAKKRHCEHFLAMANETGKLIIHNTKEKARRIGFQCHQNAVFDLEWLSEQFKLITVSGDHTARLIDVREGMQTERIFTGHTRSVKTVAVSDNDPSIFATGSRDGNILLWDTRSVSYVQGLLVPPDRVIRSSHCKSTPSCGSKRKTACNIVTAANSVTSLIFGGDSTLISCGSGDGLIKVWDLRKTFTVGKPQPLREIQYTGGTMRKGFSHLMIDQPRRRLYANCLDSKIYCFNTATYDSTPAMTYKGHQNGTFFIKACLSPDGQYITSGSSDDNAYIWNINHRHPICKLSGHTAEVTCVAWCPRGELTIVTCSDDVRHKVWRLGGETLPENWQFIGRGQCEPIDSISTPFKSLKRSHDLNEITPRQPKLAKIESAKRLLLDSESEVVLPIAKKLNSGRRLFDLNDLTDVNELAATIEEEGCQTPKASAAMDRSPEVFSPTTNLPNFVVDGSAPHLHFSPQKRVDKDWLTKIRVERALIRDMQDLAEAGPSIPKISRLDDASPRHRTPKRRNSRSSSQGQSPLLKFFRVANNSILNNSQCCPKSSLIQSTSPRMSTAE